MALNKIVTDFVNSEAFLTSANGYVKLPSGFIIQWGSSTSNASGVGTVVLPLSFPNTHLRTVTNSTRNSTCQLHY